MNLVTRKRARLFLHLSGIAIVTLWVLMIGFLVKKLHFRDQREEIASAQLTRSVDSYQREWKEIFLKDKKVGYAVNLIKPFGGGYFVQEEMFLRLNLMGLASGVHTATQCRVDDEFLLESFNFSMTSGVVAFHASGQVNGDELVIETGKGKSRRTQRIKLSSPPMVGASVGYFMKSRKLRVGETFEVPLFDPSTMAQTEAVIKVVSRESVKINRATYDAFRLEAEMWGGLLTFWVDEIGTTLKEEGFMGFTIIKSSPAKAPLDLEVEEETDFYEAASISVERSLPEPARVNYLKLQVEGIDPASFDPEVLNSARQRFYEGIMEISREALPLGASYHPPYDVHSDEMKVFLEGEFNIESDHKEIIEKAREISENANNPLTLARRLSNWVYRNLEKRPVVAVPSALEVLRTRVGDCNEHATLLTALLRASGIPAKLSVGLVYTRGKFFFHAWTEAYVGKWISIDPTLNQMPVDATHIKLVEGNLDRQVEIAGLIGHLKLKVMDYRYD